MESPFGPVGRLVVGAAGVLAASALLAPAPNAAAAPQRPTAELVNGTLIVTGTSGSDEITIDYTGTDDVALDLGRKAALRTYERSLVDRVVVRLGRGDDVFATVSGVAPAVDLPMRIRAGAGNDEVLSGNKSDIIIGAGGDDSLLGGAGLDHLHGGFGNDFVTGNAGTDIEVLGAGNDTAAWVPGEGNDVILGARGRDTLAFTGSAGDEAFSVAPNGDAVVFLRSLGSVRMDLHSLERVEIQALGGADTVTVNDLSGTNLAAVDVDLSVPEGQGDGAADTLTLNGTGSADVLAVDATDGGVAVSGLPTSMTVTGEEVNDSLQINTLGGDDTVSVTDAANALMAIAVDLGADD